MIRIRKVLTPQEVLSLRMRLVLEVLSASIDAEMMEVVTDCTRFINDWADDDTMDRATYDRIAEVAENTLMIVLTPQGLPIFNALNELVTCDVATEDEIVAAVDNAPLAMVKPHLRYSHTVGAWLPV